MLASLLPARARLQPRVFSGVAKWEVQNCLLQRATGSTRSQCIRNAVTSQRATAAEYPTSAEHVGDCSKLGLPARDITYSEGLSRASERFFQASLPLKGTILAVLQYLIRSLRTPSPP